MFNYSDVLQLASTLAYGFVYCGSETYRSEDSTERILKAYGCEDVEILVLANYFTITFTKDGETYHTQKRIYSSSNNMRKLDLLNTKTREIVGAKPDPVQMREEVRQIITNHLHIFPQTLVITGFIGLTFTLLLGGSVTAALYAFVVDFITRIILEPFYKLDTNRLFVNMFGGLLVVLLAFPCNFIGMGHEQAMIVSGSFMFLFPGVSLVNSIRDIIASDYIAGFTKLLETILVALGIALGSGLGLSIIRHLI